jgi:hypothetical protein
MKKTLMSLAIAAALIACHGRGSDSSLQRKDQQQYDVVQEGQASGATSTINAPGEVAPPPAPMTGTNADTTSNFTLPQVATSGTQAGQPGTLAQTLPQTTSGSATTPGAPPRPPRPATTTTTTQPASAQRPEHRRNEPTQTDTTGTSVEGPPPSTSTNPPNNDTAPPPPPTQTDTQPPPSTTTT